MSFWSILETIFLGPLKLIFEIIFKTANEIVGNPGVAIIFLSLVMNVLVLPLYKRADAMQERTRDVEAKLQKGVEHIKKTFSGDERMMILQTYYRQNNYKPTNALSGSVSLLLEIPFFMAAYQFLSGLDILDGVTFGPIKDLGAPDGLIVIGPLTINLLPVLMTAINIISSAIYLKGFPLKTKIQLYAMALFFLVFLYTSPSCLVFYWTLNNLFSLFKNIFYKLKNPQKVLRISLSIIGIGCIVSFFAVTDPESTVKVPLLCLGALLQLPILFHVIKSNVPFTPKPITAEPKRKYFIAGGLFLTVLIGILIPSAFIASSPQEYIDVSHFHDPTWYIVSSACMAGGFFLVWMGVFYWLASPSGKVIFERIMFAFSTVALVNYMFFGTDLGVISPTLQYENGVSFSTFSQILNVITVIALCAVTVFCIIKFRKVTATVLCTAMIALVGMSAVNVVAIRSSVSEVTAQNDNFPDFQLSKKGKNVVVIMLDRAMGQYVPYMLKEKPELKEKFSGFTYYKNTISFGGYTNFASPALLGGYEYTPVELNRRDSESLVSKHNEALKVMPVTFDKNGYDVTVFDPVYANYKWIPDLSVFNEYPDIDAYITKGKFGNTQEKEASIKNNHRNFFCLGFMKSMPLFTQHALYDKGEYNRITSANTNSEGSSSHVQHSMSTANGFYAPFMSSYEVLENMERMTNISNGSENTFLLMTNDTTHEPALLQAPDYVPQATVDNTQYDREHADRFLVDGVQLKVETSFQMSHYHINMASFLKLGEWFDYLKENGVYDNTRIILVSDHGRDLGQIEELTNDGDRRKDVEFYYPLLMVKDFNSKEFTVSNEFMTNADVPVKAMGGLIENPVNPFTKKPINSDEKTAHDQFIIISDTFQTGKNNGNTFLPARWASVKEDLWNKNNWTFYDAETVLKDHKAP